MRAANAAWRWFAVVGCVLTLYAGKAPAATEKSAPARPGSYEWFRAKTRSSVCRARLAKQTEFRQLFTLPSFKNYLATGDDPSLTDALQAWSSDLLVRIVLSMEQDYLVVCPEHKLAEVALDPVRKGYLAQLGLPTARYGEPVARRLFRALLVMKDEIPVLRKRVFPLRDKSPDEIVEGAFGGATEVRGVWVLMRPGPQVEVLEAMVTEACRGLEPCPFWDRRLVYKTMITGEKGVAAYLPEIAVLILSRELLDDPNPLHRMVLIHELTHIAEKGAWVLQRKDWKSDFAKLSGWTRDKQGQWTVKTRQPASSRTDKLTELSLGSAFSILPDSVYLGEANGKEEKDGFVMGKSYEESLKRNDPSEDLADHVAAYLVMPSRYCYQGKIIAPRKLAWIARNVLARPPARLECKPPAPAVTVTSPSPGERSPAQKGPAEKSSGEKAPIEKVPQGTKGEQKPAATEKTAEKTEKVQADRAPAEQAPERTPVETPKDVKPGDKAAEQTEKSPERAPEKSSDKPGEKSEKPAAH